MSTDAEVNAAVARLKTIIDADDVNSTAYGSGWRWTPDVQRDAAIVVRRFIDELARREAEQAERAKPITRHSCESMEGRLVQVDWYRWLVGRFIVDWRFGRVYIISLAAGLDSPVDEITKQGQLLYLLTALKGGAA